MMRSSDDAIERLRQGNLRFSRGEPLVSNRSFTTGIRELAEGQSPFSVILGCSDSRVPLEILFDQGPGDLFVIRVAGGVLVPSTIGSIEFAVENFNCPLVVVLGHTRCGAIQATVDKIRHDTKIDSPHLTVIVDRIRPVVERLHREHLDEDPLTIIDNAVRAHVDVSVENLQTLSEVLKRRVQDGKLRILGALYHLETGLVEFFDGAA